MTENYNSGATDGSTLTRIMGLSMFASLFEGFVGGGGGGVNGAVINSVRLFILGTIIETGRRFFQWAVERFKLFRTYPCWPSRYLILFIDLLRGTEYSITAQFQEGDPSYEWIILLLVSASDILFFSCCATLLMVDSILD